MLSLFPGWHPRISPHYKASLETVDAWRQRWIDNSVSLSRNRKVNSSFLSSTIFPEAALEELKMMAIWNSWLFYWDDMFDFGELSNRPEEIEATRRETIDCVWHILMDRNFKATDLTSIAPTRRGAQSFYEIGIQIRKSVGSEDTRQFITDILSDYVNATAALQSSLDRGEVMDIDEYINTRKLTAGVYPQMALIPYAYRIDLPGWFLAHSLVKDVMEQIVIIVSFVNDIVSAHREIKRGHVDNIIPLLIHHKGLSAQEAVNHAVQMVKEAYLTFQALEPLVVRLGMNAGIAKEVQRFLGGCKDLAIGTTKWS
ncbi:hypothetical protein MferCBS31731_006119 [Microsporum ferrugineum]